MRKYYRIFACVLLLSALTLLSGCAAAASRDWVGEKPVYTGNTMATKAGAEEKVGDIYTEAAAEYVKEEPEPLPTENEPVEPEAASVAEEPVEEPEPEPEPEPEEEPVEDDGNNHDVTKGETIDEEYTAFATIGEGYKVSVTVSARGDSIVNSDPGGAGAIGESSGTNIDSARKKWLTSYYDGDKESAEEDMADYEGIDGPSDSQLSEVMKYAADLGKLFNQFGITDYDLKKPSDSSEDELYYDTYSSTGNQFILNFMFSEGSITDIDFALEEI